MILSLTFSSFKRNKKRFLTAFFYPLEKKENALLLYVELVIIG